MDSYVADKSHVVCVPYPAQGHVTPMFKLAKLLHLNGIHVTFVNTEYNHRRLLRSRGSAALDGLPDFQFKTIPDGLPESDADETQDIASLCDSTAKYCLAPFKDLVVELNSSVLPVSCIISDGAMSFSLDAAEELGIPEILFWTPSACGVLGYSNFRSLIRRGITPAKDASHLENGYLETIVDWIPAMENIKLKDLPSFVRTTDIDDILLNFLIRETERTPKASAVIINTFDAFEEDVLKALSTFLPPIYTIGPLNLLVEQFPVNHNLKDISFNLWKEGSECIEWLNSKEPNSVVYVNFGSITVMTGQQMLEFAWGLANSKKYFLWIIRPDLVRGESAILPRELEFATKDRGMLSTWCAQEQVLKHPAIGGFLSHMGWNSTLDSICAGVAMVCWPFFAEQQSNCWFACNKWGVGLEIPNDVKRYEVEKLVRVLMEGEKGKKMRNRAMEWKKMAENATNHGSSYKNFNELVKVIQSCKAKR